MVDDRRERLARAVLAGYPSGPDATVRAGAAAVADAASASALVLVEGISDQIAIETLAARQGRDLGAEGVVVMPIGGAQAVTRYLLEFGPQGAGLPIVGMCDAGEEGVVRRGLAAAGLGVPENRREMVQLGFFVCVKDLEDELIRAAGRETIEPLLESQDDLGSFRTLQQQPAWRGGPFDAQMHRFLRAGARRNLRYARLIVGALELDRMPAPLVETLASAVP